MPRSRAQSRSFANASALVAEMRGSDAWCYSPHKDVVVPPFAHSNRLKADSTRPWKHLRTRRTSQAANARARPKKPIHERFRARPKACSHPKPAREAQSPRIATFCSSLPWCALSPPHSPCGLTLACDPAHVSLHPAVVHAGGVYGPGAGSATKRETRYSQGIRQQLLQTFGARKPPIFIAEGRVPDQVFTDAKLCLAPTGEGWGIRLVKSLQSGCVPLIAQPYVEQPFESLIDYPAFSRRVGYTEVASLPSTLSDASLPPAELIRMRLRLQSASRALDWRAHSGGLAYNFTILSLCHRAVQLRGSLRARGASCEALARALLPLSGAGPEETRARAAEGMPIPWHSMALREATRELGALRRTLHFRPEASPLK